MTRGTAASWRQLALVILLTGAAVAPLTACSGPLLGQVKPTTTPVVTKSSASLAPPHPSPSPSYGPPTDSGPRHGATGRAVSKDGEIVAYVVAPDDTAGAVCNRFNRRWWQLLDTSGHELGTYPVLQIGETIVLTSDPGPGTYGANALC